MGSVKDLEIIAHPTEESMGVGRFHFSDRYSVFDWGEMPDEIPHKGEAIAVLGAYFFEKLSEKGIKHHYVGLVENGTVKPYSEVKTPSSVMEVRLVRVIKPELKGDEYDYSVYQNLRGNFLIPLEVIYRNRLPEGSSVYRRLRSGEITLEDLGLNSMPSPGQHLNPPLFDLSTKLEITDRYLKWNEAKTLAGLSDEEINRLKTLVMEINQLITDAVSEVGLINEDGKVEFGFSPQREIMVVDVFGTLDECRFTYNSLPVSKEIARIYYRKTSWFQEVEKAKKQDRQNWKSLVKTGPEPLPPRLKELISLIYRACTNEITGRQWFTDIPPLKELLEEVRSFL